LAPTRKALVRESSWRWSSAPRASATAVWCCRPRASASYAALSDKTAAGKVVATLDKDLTNTPEAAFADHIAPTYRL